LEAEWNEKALGEIKDILESHDETKGCSTQVTSIACGTSHYPVVYITVDHNSLAHSWWEPWAAIEEYVEKSTVELRKLPPYVRFENEEPSYYGNYGNFNIVRNMKTTRRNSETKRKSSTSTQIEATQSR
jgi:hypothetical protein